MKNISIKLFGAAALIAATLTVSAQNSETRNVSNFNGIVAAGPFVIHVKIDGQENVKISAPAELLKEIETKVNDNKLGIGFREGFHRENFNEKIEVWVSAKSLSSIGCSGANKIDVEGALTGDNVKISSSGASKITTEIKAGSFEVVSSGAGELNLKGKAENVTYRLSGASKIYAGDLKAEDVTISSSGASDAHVYADKTISAHMSGAGKVRYNGNGVIKDYTSSGAGSISKEKGE